MDSNTVTKIIELNQQFYQTFALQFSQTRQRLQPGVRRIMESLPPAARLLDLGCGNGELARQLARRGYRGTYFGLDFSSRLLQEAQGTLPDGLQTAGGLQIAFRQADLSQPGWDQDLPGAPYDLILAFAVLHHLPGHALRRQLLIKAGNLLVAQGRLIHSEWQFLNSSRLAARVQPWESAGLRPDQVDPDDYLMDWRQGGIGRRYVHHFTLEELDLLAAEAGFKILDTFYSDGEGGRLGLYQTWERVPGRR